MKGIRTAAIALSALVLGVLILEGVLHAWNRWLSHDPGRGSPQPPAQSAARSADGARSDEAATGHMPPWHHGLIHGTKADDVLEGTDSAERIGALAGRDRIIAQGGNDVLEGGPDADVLMGGPGDDSYVIEHHGGGADVILEEQGTDTLQLSGGRIALASVEVLRHGDDLLIRWAHDRPADVTMIRSWFAGAQYQVERLRFTDGTVVPLEPLAVRAKQATSEDVAHFAPLPTSD